MSAQQEIVKALHVVRNQTRQAATDAYAQWQKAEQTLRGEYATRYEAEAHLPEGWELRDKLQIRYGMFLVLGRFRLDLCLWDPSEPEFAYQIRWWVTIHEGKRKPQEVIGFAASFEEALEAVKGKHAELVRIEEAKSRAGCGHPRACIIDGVCGWCAEKGQ